jgi:hypothetical protein
MNLENMATKLIRWHLFGETEVVIENRSNLSDAIQWQALYEQARRFTYRLIDRTDASGGGTAVAVKLSEDFFLATVKHVVDNDHRIEVLVRDSVAISISDFKKRFLHNEADVALLELDTSDASCFEFANETCMKRELNMKTELPVIVVGYPGQFIRPSKRALLNDNTEISIRGVNPLTFRSVLLPWSERPRDGIDPPLVYERDLVVDFNPEHQLKKLEPRSAGTEAVIIDGAPPHPQGLSGGGIWLAQVSEKNGLRIPDIRLIGLQTSYYKKSGWLRGIRIGVWLDILSSN